MWALAVAAALLLGMAVPLLARVDASALGVAGGLSLLALAIGWRWTYARVASLAALALALGALRVVSWPPPATDGLTAWHGQRVTLYARVSSAPSLHGDFVSFQADATEVIEGARIDALDRAEPWQVLAGRVDVIARRDSTTRWLGQGDQVLLAGRVSEPTSPAGYPRAELLRRRGVFTAMPFPRVRLIEAAAADPAGMLSGIRSGVQSGFDRYLPPRQSALALGMLLGGSTALGPELRQQLQVVGLGHLVAVSGFNIVVVATGLNLLVTRSLGRRRALVPVVLGVVLYTAITGAPPSAVRAAIMAVLALVAMASGRIADPLTSLLLAAAAMGLVQPNVLLDVGFQLSLAATLGLVLLYPRIRELLRFRPARLADALALALAAELATLPVVLVVFQQVSIVGPVVNVLATPFVPVIMFAAGLLAAALPVGPIAQAVAWVVWAPTTGLLELVRLASALPLASVSTGRLPAASGVALALVLVGWGCVGFPELASLRRYLGQVVASLPTGRRVVAILLAGAVTAAVLHVVTRPDGYLHLSLLGTGTGRAIFVRAPSGTTILVSSTGSNPRGLVGLVGQSLRVWERGLDGVVILPGDDDVVRETLRRYPATLLIDARRDARLDLGAGAVLDLYSDATAGPSGAILYGDVWIRLFGAAAFPDTRAASREPLMVVVGGSPLPPSYGAAYLSVETVPSGDARERILRAPREGTLDLVSDGVSVWPSDEARLSMGDQVSPDHF